MDLSGIILGGGGQGKQLPYNTPIQVIGLKAVGENGGVTLSIDPPTEASYPYLKDYWVVWKPASQGAIEHPYDGQHMTFAAQTGPVGQDLANLAAGSTVKIMENNVLVPFYVCAQNYQSDLNSSGITLFVRKNNFDTRQWNSTNVNTYANSALDTFYNSEYLLLLPENVRSQIVNTKIYYTPGNGNGTVTTLQRYIFGLSATELGLSNTYANTEGTALPIASTLQISYMGDAASTQWTRSPLNVDTGCWFVNTSGGLQNAACTAINGSRPAFCLPSTTQVSLEPDSDGDYTLV